MNERTTPVLLASEERFRTLAESALVGIYVLQDGKYAYVNPAMAHIFGYSVAEMTGMSPREIVQPCDYGMVSENIQRRTTGEVRTIQYEVRGKHKDGSTRDVEVYGTRMEVNGRPALVGTLIDITERKRAEQELRQSEERFRQVAESVGDFIWEVDANGLYRYASPAVEKVLGYTPDELIGKMHFYDLFAPELREEFKTSAFKSFASQQSFRKFRNQNVNKDGKIVHLETSGVPVLDKAGKLVGYRGSDTDVTARKQADEAMKANEAALRNSQKDLQKLAGRLISAQEEELRRLSRELHDDLTQRLAVLAIEAGKLELDLIRMPEKCPETVHTSAQIKNQLIKVSEDVHTISRQLHPTILDDLGLVRAIESECSAVMRRHPVEIVFRTENVPDKISNDIGLCLYRVVQEGLRNIAAHSGSKNCEIFLRCDDHSLCLTVSDDGIGFDPLEVRKMPGLGLSSMRERVQLIQGDFSITSQPGKGTLISV